jgi:transposase
MNTTRKSYPSDVSNAEWEFLLAHLSLMREDAPQREYPLRDLFNALGYAVKTGCQWRYLPHDLPPWTAVYQQARRWVQAGVFEQIVHDLRFCERRIGLNRAYQAWTGRDFGGRRRTWTLSRARRNRIRLAACASATLPGSEDPQPRRGPIACTELPNQYERPER